MGPLPVTILCGYLGAGKTTQLNSLLRHADRRIAVMVNDFGAVQIDADLIAGATGDVLRLTNGCVCCSMDGDLFRAFDRVLALRGAVDHLVIEASGVAEPHRLATIAQAEPDLALAGVVTVVCAETFAQRLADPRTARVVEAQVAGANMLILARQDSPAACRTRSVASALNPDAAWSDRLDCAALSPASQNLPALVPAPEPRPRHFNNFSAEAVQLPGPVSVESLQKWFRAAPSALHRAKGFVRLADGRTVLLQYASGRLDVTPSDRTDAGVVVLIGTGSAAAEARDSLARLIYRAEATESS